MHKDRGCMHKDCEGHYLQHFRILVIYGLFIAQLPIFWSGRRAHLIHPIKLHLPNQAARHFMAGVLNSLPLIL